MTASTGVRQELCGGNPNRVEWFHTRVLIKNRWNHSVFRGDCRWMGRFGNWLSDQCFRDVILFSEFESWKSMKIRRKAIPKAIGETLVVPRDRAYLRKRAPIRSPNVNSAIVVNDIDRLAASLVVGRDFEEDRPIVGSSSKFMASRMERTLDGFRHPLF